MYVKLKEALYLVRYDKFQKANISNIESSGITFGWRYDEIDDCHRGVKKKYFLVSTLDVKGN